jgi:hypothetical protein
MRLFDRQRMRQPYSCGLVGLRRVIIETLTVTKIQPQVGQGAPERLQLAPGVRSRTSTAGLLSQPGQAKHDREYRKKHNKTLKSTPVLTRGEWSLRFLCMRVLQGFASAGRLNSMLSRQDKLGKGGSSQTETFQRDPVGNQSNLAKLGQQPEASLAWSGVTLAVKRRQRSQKPCDSASIGVRARESLLLT